MCIYTFIYIYIYRCIYIYIVRLNSTNPSYGVTVFVFRVQDGLCLDHPWIVSILMWGWHSCLNMSQHVSTNGKNMVRLQRQLVIVLLSLPWSWMITFNMFVDIVQCCKQRWPMMAQTTVTWTYVCIIYIYSEQLYI